jgi:phosphonate transport system permease protein
MFLLRMTEPRWSYFDRALRPMIDTIQMSFLGSLIGALLALPVAFYRPITSLKIKPFFSSTRFSLSLVRTLPVLVYAAILSLVFGFGVFCGNRGDCHLHVWDFKQNAL